MENKYRSILDNLQKRELRSQNDDILLVDGMNLLIRSFTVVKTITPDGVHVGGITGFLKSLNYVIRKLDPTKVIVVWDGKGSSLIRKNINSNYKSKRNLKKITNWGYYDNPAQERESIVGQKNRVVDYLDTLPVYTVDIEKLEADDVIAFLAKKISGSNKRCIIASTDEDYLQLIDSNTSIYNTIKKQEYTHKNVLDKIKVLPENYNIAKAIVGDKSDDLRGVPGAGLKTVAKEFKFLTERKSTLQEIYDITVSRIDSNSNKKIYSRILNDWDLIESNYSIMNLHKTLLTESQIEMVYDILSEPTEQFNAGEFESLLAKDKIDSITKNTLQWLQVFKGLLLYK